MFCFYYFIIESAVPPRHSREALLRSITLHFAIDRSHSLSLHVLRRTHPVLIQGETSVGKTSLIRWLAAATGNQCVRINNHEHTDIQEYIGCYSSDDKGKLVFKEGTDMHAYMVPSYYDILQYLRLYNENVWI